MSSISHEHCGSEVESSEEFDHRESDVHPDSKNCDAISSVAVFEEIFFGDRTRVFEERRLENFDLIHPNLRLVFQVIENRQDDRCNHCNSRIIRIHFPSNEKRSKK